MNKSIASVEKYKRLYAGLRFERSALFELIQEAYCPIEVLYPGCSTHITPAFYFPHVCFVDQDADALEFFSEREALLEYIRRERRYRRSPYIQFIAADFTGPLPLLDNQFDLLLALFTGGVTSACKRYLKTGGLILMNNHRGDAHEAAQDQELRLVATIKMSKGKYRLKGAEPGARIETAGPSRRYLRQTSTGAEYIENDLYYVFQKNTRTKVGLQ